MTKLSQLKGRSGYYLVVAVPRPLRAVIGSSKIQKKAGKTHAEALRNRPALLMEIEQRLRDAASNDPIANTLKQVDQSHELFAELLEGELKKSGVPTTQIDTLLHGSEALQAQGIQPDHNPALEARLAAGLKGSGTYHQWIETRTKEELPAASTIANWKSRLKMLAAWAGTDYLGGLSKDDCVKYKGVLLDRNTHQTVRTTINTLKSFWNWGRDNGQVNSNPWEGLTRKLAGPEKKTAIATDVMSAARAKADERNDIQFWIQTYTGCRKQCHGGLRWCDIDTDNQLIHFKLWEQDGRVRRLKGNTKDERSVPISSKLMTKLELMLPEAFTNNSTDWIWDDYKAVLQSWGVRWAERFTDAYGFSSHNLRSYVVTQLINTNTSPFILYEVTRHKVPGLSDVVSGYVRPKLEELRAVVELLD